MDSILRGVIRICEGPEYPFAMGGRIVSVLGRYFEPRIPGLTVDKLGDEGPVVFIGDCPFCGEPEGWTADVLSGSWECCGCSALEQGLDVFINRLSPGLMSDKQAAIEAFNVLLPAFLGGKQ